MFTLGTLPGKMNEEKREKLSSSYGNLVKKKVILKLVTQSTKWGRKKILEEI